MKVTKKQAGEHRDALLAAASISILERGFDATGVAEVSKMAGLTHGAFYGHFKSKNDLAAAACECAFEQFRTAFSTLSLEALIDKYLSTEHRDDRSRGCPSVLATEVGRQSAETQERYADGIEGFVDLVANARDASGRTVNRGTALSLVSSMMGGLSLSRAMSVTNPSLSIEILKSVRQTTRDLAGAESVTAEMDEV